MFTPSSICPGLGWRVAVYGSDTYTSEDVSDMLRVCDSLETDESEAESYPVVFAVSARLALRQPTPLLQLLKRKTRSQLLVWTGTGEPPLHPHDLEVLKENLHGERVGFDCQVAKNSLEQVSNGLQILCLAGVRRLVSCWFRWVMGPDRVIPVDSLLWKGVNWPIRCEAFSGNTGKLTQHNNFAGRTLPGTRLNNGCTATFWLEKSSNRKVDAFDGSQITHSKGVCSHERHGTSVWLRHQRSQEMQTPRHGNFKHQKWVEGMWSMLDMYVYLGPVLHMSSLAK